MADTYFTWDGRYRKFYSYCQLINWLAQYNYPHGNTFLDRCGNNSNDSRVMVTWENYGVRLPRDYRIYNENWHSIFSGKIVADVREATYMATTEKDRQLRERNDKEWRYMLERAGWQHSRTWRPYGEIHPQCHTWGHYRRGAQLRDFRYATDPEHAPYIRAARNRRNLPDAWDDCFSRCSSGWKNSTKYRHQWEARARREAAKQLA